MQWTSRLFTLALLLGMSMLIGCSTVEPIKEHQADIVVYGDASGGVIAAIAAKQQGKDVILVSQYGHLGGLTSSGLGWTDLGNPRILGGLSREFYHRLYMHYQNDSAWVYQSRDAFPNKGQGTSTFDEATQLASVFEPKVAEKVLDEMAEEAGVTILYGRLDLQDGVIKRGKRITAIQLEDGRTIYGKMFIDASYEGDLMPGAGCVVCDGPRGQQ